MRPHEEPAGQLPVAEGQRGVQPQAQEVAQGASVPLEAPTDIPRFSGSDEQGWTLHFGGKSEGGFETRAEAEVAAHQVMAGDRVMPGPGAEETGAPMSREELQRRDKEHSRQFTPEEEDVVAQAERTAIDEGKALNTPVEPVEDIKPGDADVPWGLNFLRATGTGAQLHKANFRSWVGDLLDRGLSREQIGNAVRSRIGEEKFHNDVMARIDRPELESYWNSLTGLEKQIENYIYTGNKKGYDYVNEANRAHEAIRRRLQQAHGMTPSEFAETVGKEHVTVRTLDLLGRMIRNAREVFGTEASATQRALYDKATANIQYAKSVLSGQQPGAAQRGKEDEGMPALLPGERMVTVERPDGSTYRATTSDKEWDMGPLGKFKSIATPVNGKWSHGMLRPGEKIVEDVQPAAARRGKKGPGDESEDALSYMRNEHFADIGLMTLNGKLVHPYSPVAQAARIIHLEGKEPGIKRLESELKQVESTGTHPRINGKLQRPKEVVQDIRETLAEMRRIESG